jgi:signal transduction histidine kinase
MSGIQSPQTRSLVAIVLATALSLAIGGLVWLAYRGVVEWRRGAELLVENRRREVLALLAVALNRDMKGAHNSVLAPLNEQTLDLERPYNLADTFAGAFARFPYPESFFVWKDGPTAEGTTYVFNRADRPPAWDTEHRAQNAYPVTMLRDVPAVGPLLGVARQQSVHGRRFAVFETTIAGVQYQAVVHLLFYTTDASRVHALAGFLVNLDWVRREYFAELVQQIARIGGDAETLSLAVLDERGTPVTEIGPVSHRDVEADTRSFLLLFLDPALVPSLPPNHPPIRKWAARVSAAGDPSLAAAVRGSTQTFWLISFAAIAAMLGLLLTMAAIRAGAQLAAMKSEFVSSVTHELKTPLALIQLVGETLAKGRYRSPETIRDYAGLLSQEAQRLARLIDNLLAYASMSDVKQAYSFEELSVTDLVERALESFDGRLVATGVEVKVDVPADLPRVRADSQTMLQVLDNIIDNALKYSPGGGPIAIRGYVADQRVHVAITDRGVGIPKAEITKVFQKFYRANGALASGSGLGLAIARRVMEDHGGAIAIDSVEGRGTTVDLSLPASGPAFARAGTLHELRRGRRL